MATSPFVLSSLLRTKAFWIVLCINTLWAGLLASQPLTGILGFEFCFLFCVVTTVSSSHFTLLSWRRWAVLAESTQASPRLSSGLVRLWCASILLLVPGLLLICANAFRITNCNFATGFAYFGVLPGAGTFFGVAIGTLLATLRRQRLAAILVYALPLLGIAYAVGHGLLHPPIFAYDPYFGYFPGSLYDELREVTRTLLLYRLSTVALSALLVGIVAVFAGKQGLLGTTLFAWRDAVLERDPKVVDGRLRWGQSGEQRWGSVIWTLAAILVFGSIYQLRHELGTSHTNQSIQQGLGGRYESPHFILYYDRNQLSTKRLQQIVRDHEFRYHQLSKFFRYSPKRKIESYLFKSSAQKAHYMGAARTMIARPWAYQFYLHGYGYPHHVLKHEMAHVFTAHFGTGPLKVSARYGVLMNTALIEGVAVAADWGRSELTPHAWSRAMLDLKRAPDPVRLLSPTGFFSQAAWSAYTIAGSLSRYLIDTYGIGRYKRVYGRGEFQKVYGKSLRQLTNEWHTYLRTKIKLTGYARRMANYRFRRYRSIFARVCPHEMASLRKQVYQQQRMGALPKAIELQSHICRLEPRGYNMLRLLRLKMSAKQYDKARILADALLKRHPAKKAPILHARLQTAAGELAYKRGDKAAALRHYKAAAKEHIYLGHQRTLLVHLYALKHPTLSKVMMDYLQESRKVSTLLALQHAFYDKRRSEKDPMLAYLLARRLYFDGEYKRAIPYLARAADALRALPLQAEILRLQGRAHFAQGKYDTAAVFFKQLSQLPLPSGLVHDAKDWQERSLWEKKTYGTPPQQKKKP